LNIERMKKHLMSAHPPIQEFELAVYYEFEF
jgi:hypothetical protein